KGGHVLPVTLKDIFLSDYYTPNYYGKYYAAVFATLSKLFNDSDFSLSANAISNLSDASSTVSTTLNYVVDFDTSVALQLSRNLGELNREYTLSGNTGTAQLSLSMNF
ncbi:MAG: hypothetical protein GY786_23640, partial [Proteobacteria bacterium]|nr:hypothetical protein [Pseudomonadota bacterium]